MKKIKHILLAICIGLTSACASTTTQGSREYVAIEADDLAYIVSGIQEAIHLASGSLAAADIELESAELTLGVGDVVKSGANVGFEVLTASTSNDLNSSQTLVIKLSPIPFEVDANDSTQYLNSITNETVQLSNIAIQRKNYIIVNSLDNIDSDVGRLAYAIAAPLGGLIGANDKPPFKVNEATMTLGITVSSINSAGITGFKLGSATLGATLSKTKSANNQIVLVFKPK